VNKKEGERRGKAGKGGGRGGRKNGLDVSFLWCDKDGKPYR